MTIRPMPVCITLQNSVNVLFSAKPFIIPYLTFDRALDISKTMRVRQKNMIVLQSSTKEIAGVLQTTVNVMALFSFQMCIAGGLGIPGTRKERSTSRNAFVS